MSRLVHVPSEMSETEWQQQVTDLCNALGWEWNFTRRTRGKGGKWTTATSKVGWPDLCLWSPRRRRGLIVAELKTDARTSKCSDDQIEVLRSLAAAGVPAYVWRPRDLDDVQRILTGRDTCPHLQAPHVLENR